MATAEQVPTERKANPAKSFLTGGFGGICNVLSGHPLDTIKVRLQTMPRPAPGEQPLYRGTFDCAAKTIKNEGVRGLYKGMSAPLTGVAPIFAMCFAGYALGKRLQQRGEDARLTYSQIFVAGSFSGLFSTLIMAPGERIKVLLQTQHGQGGQRKYNGMIDCAGKLYKEGGLRSVFKGSCATMLRGAFLLLAIGFLAITTAVLVKVFQPYDLIFKWKLIMADKGEIFNLWAQPPVDLYIKIYLFNITNAEAFLAGREQLKVEQVGPYVYKEIMTHENITFNENNTMSTTPSHPLVWQEHMSEGHREDDEVIMLNIAMLAISHLTASHPFFVRMALKTLFVSTQAEPIVRTTAKEFMFGYPSALARLGNTFLPNWISFEKVGLIDRMYDFSTDFETFYTGVPNPALSGLYATYRGETTLPQWQGDHCSNIEYASDGTKFKSFIEPNETVKFFRKSMCRPINLYRVGEERTFGSLKGYNYVFEDNAFDNGATNEANKCFCRKGDCQPVGLIDVTDCYYGFPISLSFPHFMNGDVGLQQNITGMNPDPAQHSSAFVIQPESGLPLSLSVKVQINMHFKDLSNFPTVSKFSHLTAPMLWFEIMMPSLPDSLDSRFNFYLNILPLVNPLGFWLALIVGLGLLGYAITRATLHMSSYARQAANISEGKYARANLLQNLTGGATNQVYSPCELKLIDNSAGANKQHVIGRSTVEDLAFQERRRKSAYALEMEPALSDAGASSDEGNECDTLTLSRNSTTSSSCIEVEHCNEEDDICIECFDENALDTELAGSSSGGAEAKHQLAISFASSGFASSPSSIRSSSSNVNVDSSDGKGWVPYAYPHQFGGTSPKHV